MSAANLEAIPPGNRKHVFRGVSKCIACICLMLFTANCDGATMPAYSSTLVNDAESIQSQSSARANVRKNDRICTASELASTTLVEGKVYRAPAIAMEKPEKGEHYIDPAHGTCVARVTDHHREPPVGFARND